MRKIAVTGGMTLDRLLMVQALSYFTGYDIIRQTAYSCRAIKYDLSETIEECDWSDLFVYVLSSFTERIEIEQQYDGYISNGGVFHELSYMESLYKSHVYPDHRKSKEYASMLFALRKIVLEYAIREYDFVIHIDSLVAECGIHQLQECSLKHLIKEFETLFVVDKDLILSETLQEMSLRMGIKPVYPATTSIRKAQLDVLGK